MARCHHSVYRTIVFTLLPFLTWAKLLIREDFEQAPDGWKEDLDGSTAYVRVGHPVDGRSGRRTNFGVFYCPDGSCYRSEYKRDDEHRKLRIGGEYWIGFTLMLPSNATYLDQTDPNILHFQLHGGDNIGRGPVLGVGIHNSSVDSWRLSVLGDDRPSSVAPKETKWSFTQNIGSIGAGRWQDFVIHLKLEYTPVGFVNVWHNGVLAVNKSKIATAFNDVHAPYLKVGTYVNKPFKAHDGINTKWWGVSYWQLKLGDSQSSFDEVSTAHHSKPQMPGLTGTT